LFCLAVHGTYRRSLRVSPVCPDEARGITPGHDGLGYFAGRLVDRLVAEHDRTTLVDGDDM
jgi:hypothetical protein